LRESYGHTECYTYECRKTNNHIIHIVTINPKKYTVAFIKAHNQVFGRETIQSIAKRTGADIAINAGFFEMGNSQDGMPSGTLIINDHILGLNFQTHGCLFYDQQGFNIQNIKPFIEVKIGKNTIIPTKVNRFPSKQDIILYSHLWGLRTLTPLKERKEIAINAHYKVVEFSSQGNCAIPCEGFVISLPIDYPLEPIGIGSAISFYLEPPHLSKLDRKSAVMGIPILIQNGKISPFLLKNKSGFYTLAHARTALGIRSDGHIIIVVAEHVYQKPIQKVTLKDIYSTLENNKESLVKKYKKQDIHQLTLEELKEALICLSATASGQGLTLLELAQLMEVLKCESAINLDGGGSASLFLNNQVVNQPIGDQDESTGQSILRPISDAIVFKRIP